VPLVASPTRDLDESQLDGLPSCFLSISHFQGADFVRAAINGDEK
jgi:hypothetical protein